MLDLTEVDVLTWLRAQPADVQARLAREAHFVAAERDPSLLRHYTPQAAGELTACGVEVGDLSGPLTTRFTYRVSCRRCWTEAFRLLLLVQAEKDPIGFPPVLALALSGRWALPGEVSPGEVVAAVFDGLFDWGPMPADELVALVADQAGDYVVGVDATYDRGLVGAVVRGLMREGHLTADGETGRIRAPGCPACTGQDSMDGCTRCHGDGTLRPAVPSRGRSVLHGPQRDEERLEETAREVLDAVVDAAPPVVVEWMERADVRTTIADVLREHLPPRPPLLTPGRARALGLRAMSPAPGRIPDRIVDQVQAVILAAAAGDHGRPAPPGDLSGGDEDGHATPSPATVGYVARQHRARQAILVVYDGREYSATAWGDTPTTRAEAGRTLDALAGLVATGALAFRPSEQEGR